MSFSLKEFFSMLNFKNICLALAISALWACASKVPLTEPKVEDRSATAVTGALDKPIENKGLAPDAPLQSRNVEQVNSVQDTNANLASIVYFDLDSFAIKPQFQALLEGQSKRLNANKDLKMTLSGHTDDLGGREYNLSLGQKRADAVRRALSILSVPEVQMEAVSYGKEKPVDQGVDEDARAKNRRVELTVR
jgi:peptidoglycan-associated lipoprotein